MQTTFLLDFKIVVFVYGVLWKFIRRLLVAEVDWFQIICVM